MTLQKSHTESPLNTAVPCSIERVCKGPSYAHKELLINTSRTKQMITLHVDLTIANKYLALFGYKCTINTKIFTCFEDYYQLKAQHDYEQPSSRYIVHNTNSGKEHEGTPPLYHCIIFVLRLRRDNKKQRSEYFGQHVLDTLWIPLYSLAAIVKASPTSPTQQRKCSNNV